MSINLITNKASTYAGKPEVKEKTLAQKIYDRVSGDANTVWNLVQRPAVKYTIAAGVTVGGAYVGYTKADALEGFYTDAVYFVSQVSEKALASAPSREAVKAIPGQVAGYIASIPGKVVGQVANSANSEAMERITNVANGMGIAAEAAEAMERITNLADGMVIAAIEANGMEKLAQVQETIANENAKIIKEFRGLAKGS